MNELNELRVRITARDNDTHIALSGELTELTLRSARVEEIRAATGSVACDISSLDMMDHSGVALLSAMKQASDEAGNTFRVVGIGGQPAKVLGAMGVDQVFTGG